MSFSRSPRSSPAPHARNTSQPVAPKILPDRSLPSDAGKAAFVPAWRRPTLRPAGSDGTDDDGRRPSVQFVPQVKTDPASPAHSRSSSAQPGNRAARPSLGGRRMSSPPPPAQFRPSVSFDTFSNNEARDFSLTLNRKHRDYEYTKRSRTFLCGTDTNEYSDTALEWLIDELVDDGDEVVCLRVVEKDSREAVKWSGGMGEKGYRKEANRFLEAIEKKNTEDRAISLVLEFAIGKVHDTIQQMIRIYEPAILVVGTKGRSLTGYQGLLSSGSVSKYCLQYSPVPVIVVRPSSKREAKKRKRQQDPSRTGYRDILDKSDDVSRGRGGHLLDAQNWRAAVGSPDLGALGQMDSASGDPDHEARMVAEAIGYRGGSARTGSAAGRTSTDARSSSLSRVTSGQSQTSIDSDMHSPREALLKSPDLRNLDELSDDDLDDEDDGEDIGRLSESIVSPDQEALQLAYERAQKIREEELEEEEARAQREAEREKRSASRGNAARSRSRRRGAGGDEEDDGGRGAGALGLLAQLDRGMK